MEGQASWPGYDKESGFRIFRVYQVMAGQVQKFKNRRETLKR